MTKKAVIWCEDQGALAYASDKTGQEAEMDWPEPGDLIGLETEDTDMLRQVTTMWMVNARACPQLPAALRGETNRPASQLSLVASAPASHYDGAEPANRNLRCASAG
ncbi:MAG: hypothetical protein Q4G36_06910 [Paracoccus sp. (in: a-proteobacteria)]|nr:hypothetical protein [Paracoccus sp. (in: a-proteobacteria)]